VGRFFFPDWKAGGHGTVDVRRAIANSVNTFFYMVGGGLGDREGLGIERMAQAARRFGVGEPTGIDLPSEARGFFPTAAWKEEVKQEPWYIGDTYHAAIGQGDVLLTPLQVAVTTAAIANGGTRYAPHLVERIVRAGSEEVVAPSAIGEPVGTPASLQVVREGMRDTVLVGSAKALQAVPMPAAGKTGTAQWKQGAPTHAWFTGFAPLTNPELVVTILVEQGGEGSVVSVPIARDLLTWWYRHRMVSSSTQESP
jgi:penicillin-binding protein 2